MSIQRMNLGSKVDKVIYCSIDRNGKANYTLEKEENSVPISLEEPGSVEHYLIRSFGLHYSLTKYSEIYRENVRNYIQFLLDNNLENGVELLGGKLTKVRLDRFRKGDFKFLYGGEPKSSRYINVYCKGLYGGEYLASIGDSKDYVWYGIREATFIRDTGNAFEYKSPLSGSFRIEGIGNIRALVKNEDESWKLKISEDVLSLLCEMKDDIGDFDPYELRNRCETLKFKREKDRVKQITDIPILKVFLIKGRDNKTEITGDKLEYMLNMEMELLYVEQSKTVSFYKIKSCKDSSLEGMFIGIFGIEKLLAKVNACGFDEVLKEQDVRVLRLIGGITTNINLSEQCDLCKSKTLVDCYIPGRDVWGAICFEHYVTYNCALGAGMGQLLIPKGSKYAD